MDLLVQQLGPGQGVVVATGCVHACLWGLVAGGCLVAGSDCRHTHSGEGSVQQQVLGLTEGALTAVGAFACSSVVTEITMGAHITLKAGDKGQARSIHMHSCGG